MMDANNIVLIIGAVGLLLVNVINALGTKRNSVKLDEIHTLTNSNLAKLQNEMDLMRTDNEYFKKIIAGLIIVAPKDSIDKVKGDVDRRMGANAALDTSAKNDAHQNSAYIPDAVVKSENLESIKTLAENLEIKPKEKGRK